MNWPISSDIAAILVACGRQTIPEIEWVLKGTDDIWKGNCIRCILLDLPPTKIKPLLPLLERIQNSPTESEKEEEADDDAKSCIEYIYTS